MITSIICEYNPFHNGHKYQIEKAREKGSTHIVSIMSGDTVQRGDIAIFSKHYRAKQAVLNGADLVIELPAPFCISSAEGFAKSGVYIANAIGSDCLCFGCENDDLDTLCKAAELSDKLAQSGEENNESNQLRKLLKEGNSYPAALSKAAEIFEGKEVAEVFSSPNNTLAVEYLKAVKNTEIKPMPILRKGAGHNDDFYSGEYASASKIRELLKNGLLNDNLLPYSDNYAEIRDIKNMEKGILFSLIKMDKRKLREVPDCSGDLADRILKALKTSRSYDELIINAKTKAFTAARIRRVVMYAVLGINRSDFQLTPYARVLAFNDRGTEILSKAKKLGRIDISTSLKELEHKNDNNKRLAELDARTSDFAKMCQSVAGNEPNEYSVRIEKTNI